MAAVTEVDLYNAIQLKMMTAAETLNAVDFTATAVPSWEGSTTAFPNGRNK